MMNIGVYVEAIIRKEIVSGWSSGSSGLVTTF